MRKYFCCVALMLAFMVSCQNEDDALNDALRLSEMEVTASLEEAYESRTALSPSGNVYNVVWSEGDILSVFYGSADAHNKFTLKSGAGQTNATFKSVGEFEFGTSTEDGTDSFTNIGYYPYSNNTTVTKQTESYVINGEIPVNQAYADNTFGKDASPMVALSDALKFAFKNVATYLRVKIKGNATIIKATLESKTKKIAGPCEITVPTDTKIPTVSIDDTDGSSIVVLNFDEGLVLNPSTEKQMFFVLSPGIYVANDLVMTFYDNTGAYFQTALSKDNEFERSMFKTATRTYEITGKASGVDIANEALNSGSNNVSVTIAEDDENPTLMLPESSSEESTELSFESIPSDKTVTIQAQTEGTNVEGSLIVKAPSTEEGTTGNNFVINLPNSTVTLSAKGESATYNSVTAHTAANTLIVSEGVKITTLEVKGGNVRVKGEISSISRHQENSDEITYIIKEEGAVIPTSLGDGLKVVSAAEWDLRKAIENGGTYTLNADVALSETLVIDGVVVLNLDGYNISVDNESTELAEGDAIIVYGNLTLNGEGTVTGNTRAVWARGNGSKVTINGGKYIGSTKAETEVIYASGDGVIDIYGGEFEATNQNQNDFASPQYAVLNLHGNGKDGADINVYGGSFKNFDPSNNVSENASAGYHDGNFVALGYSSVADGNGNYVVSEGIANEKALVAAVAAGGTVTLSNNITLSKTLLVDGTVVLNLGGYNISVDNESTELAEGDAIIVYGNLTLNGEGTVTGNTRAVWARGNGSKVTINGGKYIGSTKAETEVIYASGDGVINIYGGEFEATNQNQNDFASPQYAVLNLHGNGKDGADINVYGGSFKNFDPSNNVSENASAGYHNGNFVSEGYSSYKDGDYYKVSATSEGTTVTEALSVVNW